MTTGDSVAPGNYALLDVIAALRWIQENIRPFGGNFSDVTLVGQGHGAAMVNLLLLSPVTKGQWFDVMRASLLRPSSNFVLHVDGVVQKMF